jgi:hypothetical protein
MINNTLLPVIVIDAARVVGCAPAAGLRRTASRSPATSLLAHMTL